MDRGYGIQPFPQGGFRGGFAEHVGRGGPSDLAWVIFALLLVLLLLVIVSLALDAYHRSQPAAGRSQTATGALALLDLRYARGEVDRDAYLQARADLSGAEAATLVMPAPSEPPEQPSG